MKAQPKPRLKVVRDEQMRRDTLDEFARMMQLPKIARVIQRGAEPENARYTFELADGRSIRIGGTGALWSQAQLGQVVAASIQRVPPEHDMKTWRKLLGVLMRNAVEVEEAPGESFAEIVCDWLRDYARSPGTDADGCAAAGRPFIRNEQLHIHAPTFSTYVKRQLHGTFERLELLQALVDIGFERKTINYVPPRGTRTSISLYVALRGTLDVEPTTEDAAE